MERIFPSAAPAVFVRQGRAGAVAAVVSELGVYGTFLSDGSGGGGDGDGMLLNEEAGYLLRTKVSESDEGGVAAGFAVLDSVLAVGE